MRCRRPGMFLLGQGPFAAAVDLVNPDDSGNQKIYSHAGAPVWLSMDLSYWGKRRFRVMPGWAPRPRNCVPP